MKWETSAASQRLTLTSEQLKIKEHFKVRQFTTRTQSCGKIRMLLANKDDSKPTL